MSPILNRDTIVINDSGGKFAYTDTGPHSQSPYITIVTIHGMAFCARMFRFRFRRRLFCGVRQWCSKEFKMSLSTKEYAILLSIVGIIPVVRLLHSYCYIISGL